MNTKSISKNETDIQERESTWISTVKRRKNWALAAPEITILTSEFSNSCALADFANDLSGSFSISL